MSSQPLRRRSRVNSSSGKVAESPAAGRLDGAAGHVDGDLECRVGLHRGQQRMVELGSDLHREQALLGAVVAEDVGEPGGDDRFEAVVHERPHGVLTGGAGAEVVPGHQNGGAHVLGMVEDEVAVVAPFGEQPGTETGALDALEPVRGDDLVGVDVGAVERHGAPGDDGDGLHQSRSSGVAKVPATAVAAATSARPGGCARPGPDGLRSSGWRWRRSARPPPACRGSWPGTSSSPARATRTPPPRRSCRAPRLRPGP